MAKLLSVCSVAVSLLMLAQASRASSPAVPYRYPASFVQSDHCEEPGSSPQGRHAFRKINSDIHSRLVDVAPLISRGNWKPCSLGHCQENPVFSCAEMREVDEDATSGYYWLRLLNGSSVNVYCDFDRPACACSGATTDAWMRIAFHNMSNPNHTCPFNLQLNEAQQKRMCTTRYRGCTSVFFDTLGLSYSSVCGRVIGVQFGEPNAFRPYYRNRALTLEDPFVDGVILTCGQTPRTHVWTFVAVEDETQYDDEACPCTRTEMNYVGVVPPFIGDDYFCDTGSRSKSREVYYTGNPLWDGTGCGSNSLCCSWQGPPWFCKQLPQMTRDSLELRVCTDSPSDDEQVLLELVEIYIQ